MKPQVLYSQYRNVLSDYTLERDQGLWPAKQVSIADEFTGEILEQMAIPILKPENIGEKMNIDDKHIGKQCFTILSNNDTGKIAMTIPSIKYSHVSQAISLFGSDLTKVKYLCSDMAASYLKLGTTIFPNATTVIDKFHVIRYIYDSVQDVRKNISKELRLSLSGGKRKTLIDNQLLSDLELLSRTKYLICRQYNLWSADQTQMMSEVFHKFPKLQQAYDLAMKFRQFYDGQNVGKNRILIEKELFRWYTEVENSEIKEFRSAVKMIEKHEDGILNYFIAAQTNAKAERLNGKIQRFISNNYGVKDIDFTLYRIKNYFA